MRSHLLCFMTVASNRPFVTSTECRIDTVGSIRRYLTTESCSEEYRQVELLTLSVIVAWSHLYPNSLVVCITENKEPNTICQSNHDCQNSLHLDCVLSRKYRAWFSACLADLQSQDYAYATT